MVSVTVFSKKDFMYCEYECDEQYKKFRSLHEGHYYESIDDLIEFVWKKSWECKHKNKIIILNKLIESIKTLLSIAELMKGKIPFVVDALLQADDAIELAEKHIKELL